MSSESQNMTQMYRETSQDANALRVRLEDIKEVHARIESFLSGEIITYHQSDTGDIVKEVESFGEPKLNKKGIQSVMAWITMSINTQTVQGNMTDKFSNGLKYDRFIQEFQIDLGDLIFVNMWDWDVKDNEYRFIVDGIMHLVQLFLSRLIDNKERESYSQSLKSNESNIVRDKGFNFFNK